MPMIWVDMDGVLADFDRGYLELFGGVSKELSDDIIWSNVRAHGSFFSSLPVMDRAPDLWAAIDPRNAHVLTALAKSIPECHRQKLEWLERFGIGRDRVVAVLGKKNKVLYCRPGDILIDDHPQNIIDWEASGGRGILYHPADVDRVIAVACPEATSHA